MLSSGLLTSYEALLELDTMTTLTLIPFLFESYPVSELMVFFLATNCMESTTVSLTLEFFLKLFIFSYCSTLFFFSSFVCSSGFDIKLVSDFYLECGDTSFSGAGSSFISSSSSVSYVLSAETLMANFFFY